HRGVKWTLTSRQARTGSISTRAAIEGGAGTSTTVLIVVPRLRRGDPKAWRRARRTASSSPLGEPRPGRRPRHEGSRRLRPPRRASDDGGGSGPRHSRPPTPRTRPEVGRRLRRRIEP